MAYIEKERVQEIRAELKKLFPKFKFSVTRQDYATVSVKILKGPINFFDGTMRCHGNELYDSSKRDKHTAINEFRIEDNWEGEAREMLLKVKEIVCKGNHNRNADDQGADYPDWNFFTRISVGSYDKPYELTA